MVKNIKKVKDKLIDRRIDELIRIIYDIITDYLLFVVQSLVLFMPVIVTMTITLEFNFC